MDRALRAAYTCTGSKRGAVLQTRRLTLVRYPTRDREGKGKGSEAIPSLVFVKLRTLLSLHGKRREGNCIILHFFCLSWGGKEMTVVVVLKGLR